MCALLPLLFIYRFVTAIASSDGQISTGSYLSATGPCAGHAPTEQSENTWPDAVPSYHIFCSKLFVFSLLLGVMLSAGFPVSSMPVNMTVWSGDRHESQGAGKEETSAKMTEAPGALVHLMSVFWTWCIDKGKLFWERVRESVIVCIRVVCMCMLLLTKHVWQVVQNSCSGYVLVFSVIVSKNIVCRMVFLWIVYQVGLRWIPVFFSFFV